MAKQKNGFKKSFQFSRGEMIGLVAMLCLILALIAAPLLYNLYTSSTQKTDNKDLKTLQKLVFENEYADNKPNHFKTTGSHNKKASVQLFAFNPNTASLDDWQKLGLSSKQAQAILNYRQKGGKFYKPTDLKKMYTISPQKYIELAPYIVMKDELPEKPIYTPPVFTKKEAVPIEINGADTLKLTEIKGIGATFARRIAKYRDRLGGFYAKEQLLEVYGLDSVKYNEIKNQIRLDASLLKKIAINKATFDDLKSHPYLSFKQMNALINYRNQHGAYQNLDDLKKVMLLNDKIIEKMAPYLIF